MYERTTEGFSKAYQSAQWMANFHNRSFHICVVKTAPNEYSIIGDKFLDVNTFVDGTSFCTVSPKELPIEF